MCLVSCLCCPSCLLTTRLVVDSQSKSGLLTNEIHIDHSLWRQNYEPVRDQTLCPWSGLPHYQEFLRKATFPQNQVN